MSSKLRKCSAQHVFPMETSDNISSQATGSGSVTYHCDASGLKISTAAVYAKIPSFSYLCLHSA